MYCSISTKRVVPNVALRRKEFELKANESNEWRRLSSGKSPIVCTPQFGALVAVRRYFKANILFRIVYSLPAPVLTYRFPTNSSTKYLYPHQEC